jgi:hypothetical protein
LKDEEERLEWVRRNVSVTDLSCLSSTQGEGPFIDALTEKPTEVLGDVNLG